MCAGRSFCRLSQLPCWQERFVDCLKCRVRRGTDTSPTGSVSHALVIPWGQQICPATAKLQAERGS